MNEVVHEAFLAVREERSPDVVVANPDLNRRFLNECRSRGLSDSALALNLRLLNLRKAGALPDLKSRRIGLKNQEDYRFGAEIAVRFLERRDSLSLDRILCDPERTAEFDLMAGQIAPGFTAFEYRWAALNLRKRSRLRPELLGKVVSAEMVSTCKVVDLIPTQIPARAGLYLFIGSSGVLYIGECHNLRRRITKHLDHSDNRGLAHWLWEHGNRDLHLEYHVLPMSVPTRVRKAMELELIRSRNPLFNIAGGKTE